MFASPAILFAPHRPQKILSKGAADITQNVQGGWKSILLNQYFLQSFSGKITTCNVRDDWNILLLFSATLLPARV